MVPFFFQWNIGEVPPFAGTAVNVTGVPEQTGLAEAVTVTPAGVFVLSCISNGFDVTVFGSEHHRLEVTLQVTKSPFTGENE